MFVTDLTGDTTDDGSMDLCNDSENKVVCVTPINNTLRKSRDKLKLAIGLPSITTKNAISIFNAPKDWNAIHKYRDNAFPYHLHHNNLEVSHADEVSICESTITVTPITKNPGSQSPYVTEHVIIKDVRHLLFNTQFKILYDYYKYLSGSSPELIQFIDMEHEDMSYQVRFTVKTKKDSDNLYSKLCALDRSKLPVCCIQTKKADISQVDNDIDTLDNKEIMDTLILNDKFSMILNNMFPSALKGLPIVALTKDCRANLCTIDDYCIDKDSADVEVCLPCNDELLTLSEEGTSDGSSMDEAIIDNIFPPVLKKLFTHYFTTSGCVQIKYIQKLRHIL